jgi:hypothetical protein
MKTVIEMAREAGLVGGPVYARGLDRFAELVRADEREKYKWDVHSCGPTCTKAVCVAMREAVLAEREECAKVADRYIGADPIADAIRARSKDEK